ncbi:MAG TPA: 4-hydroxy-3-methylbut-2-enyl diphosphate reductase [Acidimicrobiales bacterium]|jgi:4-hydroxy-3-methylbut-2-enyl diphosphate reductase|nr:4-hydroxy-3-methylbut-2-enyl diphosphate reductase [Acidimicrobiales bacterium]
MNRPAVILAPLRLEARALRRTTSGAAVLRTGAGPVRAARAAGTVPFGKPTVVAGVAGGLTDDLPPGTVVVADRVLKEDGSTVAELASASLLAAELRRAGLPAVVGGVVSTPGVVRGHQARARLAHLGALAVDTETAYMLAARPGSPAAVVRVIVDTPEQELYSPATVTSGIRALRQLGRCGPVLDQWSAAVRRRSVLMAGPRSFCAGVERAIATVERALDRYGAPVYVRRQIVHNRHVVEDLEHRGAVFVQEIDEVPVGATVILSAHGVSPSVRAQADTRGLEVIDATCPLVSKVHHELRRFGDRGYQVVMIGHEGHDETVGTLGEVPGTILVGSHEDISDLEVADPERLAYVTQTTLSPDDVAGLVADLRERYPAIVGPHAADICYATQNRQDAVAAIAGGCDLVVVVGSANSSNAARLVEVAARSGARAVLVDDDTGLRLDWLAGARTVGVTAAASTPARMVSRVVDALQDLGGAEVEERITRTENVNFPLPAEVR